MAEVASSGHPRKTLAVSIVAIGLALVRRIVEAHGGRISIESAGQGQGTTFHISLATAPGLSMSHDLERS